ncbi:hypothetical protein [Pseudoalteromonas xiamenensis]|uniref:Uncharacterized protein n=1 Tax=Pseudoalteromonas xiamenensis TaxID=882626 RepID=A0A975DJE3_9GAMM|nr:hypothetical protein [Pseudoalteromonas xiamenensis]QTH72232.1 hypothetical protein J5O05_04965 [Pseudoalteromonas xiamenensis]
MNSLKKIGIISIVLGFLGATYLYSDMILLPLFTSFILILAFLNKDDFNYRYLSIVIISFTLIEIILRITLFPRINSQYVGFVGNTMILSYHLAVDFLTAYCISNRKSMCLRVVKDITPAQQARVFSKSILDAPLLGVYVLFCSADILTLGENFLRHLDKIGFDQEFVQQFKSIRFFYDSYAYIKYTLISLVALLFFSIYIRNIKSQRTISTSQI